MASEQQLEIWFLCRHVYADQEVGVLIENPMEQSGNPRWSVRFESPDFGTKEQRIGLYRKSLAAGLVRVFDRPNYNDSNFFVETSFDDIRHPKFRFARSVITKAGFDEWERQFDPDWSRWWNHSHEQLPGLDADLFQVKFLSMELWPQLQESLVVLLGLDEDFGINQLQISVAFGEAVVWYKFVDHIFVASFIAKWSTGNAMQTAIETGKYEEFLQRGRAKGEIAAQLKSFSRIW